VGVPSKDPKGEALYLPEKKRQAFNEKQKKKKRNPDSLRGKRPLGQEGQQLAGGNGLTRKSTPKTRTKKEETRLLEG